jgi:hypothetical protein
MVSAAGSASFLSFSFAWQGQFVDGVLSVVVMAGAMAARVEAVNIVGGTNLVVVGDQASGDFKRCDCMLKPSQLWSWVQG